MKELMKYLSKKDTVDLLELFFNNLHCNDLNEFKALVEQLKKLIHFDCAVSGYLNLEDVLSGDIVDEPVNIGFPEEYLTEFQLRGYHLMDPIMQEFYKTFEIQNWNDVEKQYPGNIVIQFGKEFGLIDGFTYGVSDSNQLSGTNFFFSGTHIENNERTRIIIKHAVSHLSETLKRLSIQRNVNIKDPLTAREKEVLKWLKEGKSSWDISTILKISENGVNFHIKNIKEKLDAVNRVQAVVIAIENKFIEI